MRLNQITLPVKSMPEAVAFYLKLGCKLIVDTPHYARFLSPEGDTSFSLLLELDDFVNGAIIYFETDKLAQVVDALSEKGIEFEQLPTEQRYLWTEAVLHDPSGNKIKLYWAGENRLNPPWKVVAD